MQDHEAIQTLLDARGLAYESLARAFAEEPNGDVALLFASEDFVETCSVLDDGKEPCRPRSRTLRRRRGGRARRHARPNTAGGSSPRRRTCTRGNRSTSPASASSFSVARWRCARRTGAQGFQAAGYPHEPDDHLATELHFMGRLASRAARECEAGEARACAEALVASLGFLKDHLGNGRAPSPTRSMMPLPRMAAQARGAPSTPACARLVDPRRQRRPPSGGSGFCRRRLKATCKYAAAAPRERFRPRACGRPCVRSCVFWTGGENMTRWESDACHPRDFTVL